MKKSVLVISTLNTKRQETLYLKDKIEACGLEPLLMDISMRGTQASPADIPPERVAAAGGGNFDDIRNSKDRTLITDITIAGASKIAKQLQAEGKIHGITGMGGATGSFMITEVMQTLPFGLAKLMISSAAALPALSKTFLSRSESPDNSTTE